MIKVKELKRERYIWSVIAISALASIPMHISPIWVQALLENSRFSHTEANGVLSSHFLGQIVSAALLIIFPGIMTGYVVVIVATMLVVFIAASTLFQEPIIIILIWFWAGLCCGALIFAGFRAAAASENASRSFAVRLSLTLVLSGAVALMVWFSLGEVSFGSVMRTTAVVMGAILAICAPLAIRSGTTEPVSRMRGTRLVGSRRDSIALLIIMIFFAGQIAFLANAGLYISRGSEIQNATSLAAGVAKVAVGAALLIVFLRTKEWSAWNVIAVAAAGIGSVLAIAYGNWYVLPILAFTIYELTFNIQSSVLFGDVIKRISLDSQRFILIMILLGSVAGPILAGLLLDGGLNLAPAAMAVSTVLFVVCWRTYALATRARS